MLIKKAFPIFLLLIILILPSCAKREYTDDVGCYDLCEAVIADEGDTDEYESYGTDYLEYFFENTSLPNDFRIIYSRESDDIDELGVFHTENEDAAKEMSVLAENYLSEFQKDQRSFISSYAPEELPKLDNAEVKVFGNYVVYAIMDEDDKKDAFSIIEENLRK